VRGVTTPRAAGLLASYEDLAAPAQAALLADALPSMPAAWRAAVAAQTAAGAQAPASFGAVVACARFHGPRAALVGDAAHAVTSTLGQARPIPLALILYRRALAPWSPAPASMARAPRWWATPCTRSRPRWGKARPKNLALNLPYTASTARVPRWWAMTRTRSRPRWGRRARGAPRRAVRAPACARGADR